jgi:putative ABC transport system permease protein
MHLILLIFKNLRRNRLRSVLTMLAVLFLVLVFTMIASVLSFLDRAMADQRSDIALVITERYRLPSRFDLSLFEQVSKPSDLQTRLKSVPGFDPELCNLWHFIVFSLDPAMKDNDKQFFVIATIPEKLKSMVDSMEDLDPELPGRMRDPQYAGVLMGSERLKKIGKMVGDIFEAKSLSHRDGTSQRGPVQVTFKIVGELPEGSRWVEGAFMDYGYLDNVLKQAKCPMYGRINLGWVKVKDEAAAVQVSAAIEDHIREVKCEKGSSAVGRFLEGYKDLLWIVRWPLRLGILIVMSVIVANAISITVRERLAEMSVLKVLGFTPRQIFFLVQGEAVLIGLIGGLLGALMPLVFFNYIQGGIKIPFAFFPVFFVPSWVLILGPVLGMTTAFCGSVIPAWRARIVRVARVFAQIA